MPPLLSIQNLSIAFSNEGDKTVAVKNSSIEIKKGELLAIVGESGSGKSVTALSLLQLLSGKNTVTGKTLFFRKEKHPADLIKLSAQEINDIRGKDIAMIFQEPMTSLNPVFTCGYQVMECIRLHEKVNAAVAKQKTIALFEKVKLPDPAAMIDRYPHELSGGQKQRVMIAMAISCNPSLLIADEPTTALDVTVQKTILELIKELQEQNKMGVILITHDLGIVADIADKVVVMYKGEIVEQGITKDVLQAPQHPYTKALLACRPAGKAKGERLPVVSDFIGEESKKIISTAAQSSIPTTTSHQPSTVLQVENLRVYFPVKKKIFGRSPEFFKAVDDVSFEVTQGETLGLVGESGCGKTTLGRTILQLIKPSEGKIYLAGKDVTQINTTALRNMRKDLQIVFQDPYGSLNPRITIGNAILEPLSVHGILDNNNQRKDKVIALLEKVSLLPEHFNRYPHQFSGGQRQRICIARALALNPSFLIFDESVSALDVSVQAQVLNLLNDLKKEFGFTSIFISHDLSVVRYISDRILVMHKGKIVEQGAAEQIYHHPQNEYTKKLIAAIPGASII
ncbi:MAG: ABC transporter ATP-binding protein [Ferruginibacter sp.]|nr:ABC transporter ATP-binding protein [Ferruginibacter sp.]